MSLFHMHYDCHPGCLALRKGDGVVYKVVRNVSLWDMTAVLVPWDVGNDTPLSDAFITAKAKEFAEKFHILDEGKDHLSDAFKLNLSRIASGKPPVT